MRFLAYDGAVFDSCKEYEQNEGTNNAIYFDENLNKITKIVKDLEKD